MLRIGFRAHDFGSFDTADALGKRVAETRNPGLIQLALNKVMPSSRPWQEWDEEYISSITSGLKAHGVSDAIEGSYINPIHHDKEERKKEIERFRKSLSLASAFGCPYIGTETGTANPSGGYSIRTSDPANLEILKESLSQMLEEAEKDNAYVAIEAVSRNHSASSPERMRNIIDSFRTDRLKVIFDPVNLIPYTGIPEKDGVPLQVPTEEAESRFVREILDIYGDRIEVTWKDRLGADQYRVSVYTDRSGEPVTTERVPAGEGSYVFRYDDPVFSNEDVVIDYPLSREYYFTVAPMHLASTGEDCEPVTGSWVQPPRGIRASKAEFSNQIRIDWEQNMADARYRVFRRQAGSDVWTDISVVYTGSRAFVTYSESEGSTMYEYSVASELNGVIGPVQNQFDSDEANTGYPLFKPSRVAVIQPEEATNVDSELFEIELDVTPGATGYQVSSSSYSSPLVFDFSSASTTGSEGQAGYGYIDEKTSKVHLYVPRPRIQFREYFDFTLNSLKDDSVISYATDVTLVPMFYYQVEALNLAFPVLSDALHEVDEAFGNDWWEFTLAGTGKPVRYYGEEGISRVYAYSCPASNGGLDISDPASVQLNSYTSNSISLSGQFGVYPYKIMGGYAGDNSVEELTADPDGLNSLDITLPYGIGTAHVVFNNANVNENSGTYTVSIDFNRDGSYEGNEVVTVPYGDTYVEPF